MPIPINVGDIIEIRLMGKLHAQVVECTFHYEADTAAADWLPQAAAAAGDFETNVWGPLRAGLSNELMDVYFEIQIISPLRYRKDTLTPIARTGSVASNSLPSGVSIVVRRQGDIAKRWGQGRIYIPGLPQSSENDSQLAAAWVAANEAPYVTAMLRQLAAGGGALWKPRIFNLKVPARKTEVTRAVLDKVIRYQRRREIGVGV